LDCLPQPAKLPAEMASLDVHSNKVECINLCTCVHIVVKSIFVQSLAIITVCYFSHSRPSAIHPITTSKFSVIVHEMRVFL